MATKDEAISRRALVAAGITGAALAASPLTPSRAQPGVPLRVRRVVTGYDGLGNAIVKIDEVARAQRA